MLSWIKDSIDVIYKNTEANAIIIYQEQLCNILEFMKDFYPRMNEDKNKDLDELFPGICKRIENDKATIEKLIFCGLLISVRNGIIYAFDMSKAPSRAIGDSNVEPEGAFQARDGFVENFKDNWILMLYGLIIVVFAIIISYPLSNCFVRKDSICLKIYIREIYINML